MGNIILPQEGTYADTNWKLENWGIHDEVTKSDQEEVRSLLLEESKIMKDTSELVTYLFHSLNGEPVTAIQALSKQYPSLVFTLESIDLDEGQAGVEYTIKYASINSERTIIFKDFETGVVSFAP